MTRENLGFLLAKASQRWNELLYERFVAAGYPDVRPSYGSLLVPLFEEDGLRMGELAARTEQLFASKRATKHCALGRISNLSVSL